MNKKFLFAVIAATIMGNAWADDGRILTTQTYVDNELSGKVDIAQGTGDNNENVGKTLVVNAQGELELGTPSAGNYVENAINDDVTDMAPSEDAVYEALLEKQDKIPAGTTGQIVLYNGTDANGQTKFTGRQITTTLNNNTKIPTSGAVFSAVSKKQDIIVTDLQSIKGKDALTIPQPLSILGGLTEDPGTIIQFPLLDKERFEAAISSYGELNFGNLVTTFDSNQDAIPTAGALWIPFIRIGNMAQDATDIAQAATNEAQHATNLAQVALNVLNTKQNQIPAGTAGDVVTYTGTEGVVGSVATYTGATTYNATNDANKIPTMSGVTAWAQAKKLCVRWLDTPEHPEHNDENCLLWELPD